MKILADGEWFDGEGADGSAHSVAKSELRPMSSVPDLNFPPPPSQPPNPTLVDGLKSKFGSFVKSKLFEDQTKVTEAQHKALEIQNKVMETQKKAVQNVVDMSKGLIERVKAKQDYELLNEERKVKEMNYQLKQSQLELERMKLEAEKQKIAQRLNGTHAAEPDEIADIRADRRRESHHRRQIYMAETEEDSVTAQCQALDAWYDEKQAEIMGNQHLDVARRRQQLDMLDKEYKLRKKKLDDQINAQLGEDDTIRT